MLECKNDVSEIIKRIREKKNLSQTRFGRRIGISPQSVSAYENRKSTPPLKVLERISNEYDVDLYDATPKRMREIGLVLDHISKLTEKLEGMIGEMFIIS